MLNALKKHVASTPIIGSLAKAVYRRLRPSLIPFRTSSQYWTDRYERCGNSGAGSYNRLALFKSDFLNNFVREHNIQSVVEFGSGDGAQLALAEYPCYIGYDISPKAVELCKNRFRGDYTKEFRLVGDMQPSSADLALSLDVIYHLIENDVFDRYMHQLFDAASRFVIIYSSNEDKAWTGLHVRHRHFTPWIEQNRPEWKLHRIIPNAYPFDEKDQDNTSFADFHVFARQ
jgi:SAM-dependent methyltransferase